MINKLFLSIFISMLMTSTISADGFIIESIDQASKLAKSTDKLLLVVYGSKDCIHCINLKKDILDSELTTQLDRFIVCYIDTDKNPDVMRDLKIKILPYSRVLDDSNEIAKFKGYTKDTYYKWIENVKR